MPGLVPGIHDSYRRRRAYRGWPGLGPAMTAEFMGPEGMTRGPTDFVITSGRRKASAGLYCRDAR